MGIKKPPFRLWISFIIFCIAYVTFAMKVNMTISLPYIIEDSKDHDKNNTDLVDLEDGLLTNAPTLSPLSGSVVNAENHSLVHNDNRTIIPPIWSQEILNYIIDSYFWGFVLSSAPSGFIAERYGPYNTILYSLILMIFTNSLCVRAAEWHYAPLILCRFILGVFSAAIFPALQTLISIWSPPGEKGKFSSCLMGSCLGITISWMLIGPISIKYGWDWGFHIFSIQAAVVCLLFGIVAFQAPSEHKWVSSEEKKSIKESQGSLISNLKVFPPYLKMATSLPFWALSLSHIGSLWGLYFNVCLLPVLFATKYEYLGHIYSEPNIITVLPFLLQTISGIGFGFLDDVLKIKKSSSKTAIRRWFVLLSHILPGVVLIFVSFTDSDVKGSGVVALLITASFTLNGASVNTNLQNVHDLAPNFSGSMYGLINSIGSIAALVIPVIVGSMNTSNVANNNGSGSNTTFLISGCIYIVTGLVFALFGSGETQSWNSKLGQRLEEEVPIREENGVNNGLLNSDRIS